MIFMHGSLQKSAVVKNSAKSVFDSFIQSDAVQKGQKDWEMWNIDLV